MCCGDEMGQHVPSAFPIGYVHLRYVLNGVTEKFTTSPNFQCVVHEARKQATNAVMSVSGL